MKLTSFDTGNPVVFAYEPDLTDTRLPIVFKGVEYTEPDGLLHMGATLLGACGAPSPTKGYLMAGGASSKEYGVTSSLSLVGGDTIYIGSDPILVKIHHEEGSVGKTLMINFSGNSLDTITRQESALRLALTSSPFGHYMVLSRTRSGSAQKFIDLLEEYSLSWESVTLTKAEEDNFTCGSEHEETSYANLATEFPSCAINQPGMLDSQLPTYLSLEFSITRQHQTNINALPIVIGMRDKNDPEIPGEAFFECTYTLPAGAFTTTKDSYGASIRTPNINRDATSPQDIVVYIHSSVNNISRQFNITSLKNATNMMAVSMEEK